MLRRRERINQAKQKWMLMQQKKLVQKKLPSKEAEEAMKVKIAAEEAAVPREHRQLLGCLNMPKKLAKESIS